MAIWNRNRAHASAESQQDHYDKAAYNVEQAPYEGGVVVSDEGTYSRHHNNTELHRGLHARHITMIAIGGAIGTGLIIGTGSALAKAGPGAIFIAYTIIGFIVYLVMCALGEMATWLPTGKNFAGYATRFVDPALGFSLGYTYLFKYLITTPNQLTAAALVLQYWVCTTFRRPFFRSDRCRFPEIESIRVHGLLSSWS